MSSKSNSPKIPIIGLDEELQERMREDLHQKRNNQSREQRISKLTAFEKNERKNTRYEISNSVVCYPVLESGEIAMSYSMVGIALNIGYGGVKVLVDSIEPKPGMELVIGIEQSPGDYRFCAGTVISTRKSGESGFETGIEFRGYMHEVLQCEQIIPVLDRQEMQYELPFPANVMASLCKVGAATSTILDSMLLCANCRGIPTLREGCSMCLSSNVRSSKMIHHFGCAHVDFVENFEQGDELVCQKCRCRSMIIGADYEYLDGPNMCYDCGQANLEKIQIGHCLSCEHRFPMTMAHEMEIIGYRVSRLDILVFIGTTH